MSASIAAVVEIGSGAVKATVRSREAVIERSSLPFDLIRAVNGAGRLSEQALSELSGLLTELAQSEAVGRADLVGAIGTAAVRRLHADAVEQLTALVNATLGVSLEVVDGRAEAELALRSVTAGLASNGQGGSPVVIDIGGGSSEFSTWGSSPEDVPEPVVFSLPMGAAEVTRTYLASDPPRAEELSAALSVIELHLTDLTREAPAIAAALSSGRVFGVGSFGVIARVERGEVDEEVSLVGETLSRAEIEEIFRALATESIEDRAFNPGLAPQHVVDVVGALCLLVETVRHFGIDSVTLADGGVGDGLARNLLDRP